MKYLFTLLIFSGSLCLCSCVDDERGTPGTGTYDIGTGQEPHHVPGIGSDTQRTVPVQPADSIAPGQ